VPFGTLIGKIGNGLAFKIGQDILIEAKQQGQLFLTINDARDCLGDNNGEITVKITLVSTP